MADGATEVAEKPSSSLSTSTVEAIVRSLQARLGDTIDNADLTAEVETELAAYAAARVTTFVPILVERRIRRHAPTGRDAG